MRSREVEECVRDIIVSCEGCTKNSLLPSCNFSFCAWSSSNKETLLAWVLTSFCAYCASVNNYSLWYCYNFY